jgi:hypothetical protein
MRCVLFMSYGSIIVVVGYVSDLYVRVWLIMWWGVVGYFLGIVCVK